MDSLTQAALGASLAGAVAGKTLGRSVLLTGAVLGTLPDLDVVIDHMADVHPDDAEGCGILMDLARYPRVYVKISHTWSISNEEYPWRDTHGLVEQVYQSFGPRKIMWGTDWPVCLPNAEYGQTLSTVRDEMSFIAPEDLEWVLGKTVQQLWTFS